MLARGSDGVLVPGVELGELLINVRHCRRLVHRLDPRRVRAAAAAWDACRDKDIRPSNAPKLRRDVPAVAVAVEGLYGSTRARGFEPPGKVVPTHHHHWHLTTSGLQGAARVSLVSPPRHSELGVVRGSLHACLAWAASEILPAGDSGLWLIPRRCAEVTT